MLRNINNAAKRMYIIFNVNRLNAMRNNGIRERYLNITYYHIDYSFSGHNFHVLY